MDNDPSRVPPPDTLYIRGFARVDPGDGASQAELFARLRDLGLTVTYLALNESEPLIDSPALDTDVETLLAHEAFAEQRNTAGHVRLTLGELGVHNLRDILLAGQQKFRDIEGPKRLGPKALNILARSVKIGLEPNPTLGWLNQPSARFAARICHELSDVTVLAIAPFNVIRRALPSSLRIQTVDELLAMPHEEIVKRLNSLTVQNPHEMAANLKVAAHTFARNFADAKQTAQRGIHLSEAE